MRKKFPFGVPRGVLSVHIALSKLSLVCKSPGRALQASGEQGLTPLEPAPNRNILHIRDHFPTRWARFDVFPGAVQIREVPVAYPEAEPRRRTGKGLLPCDSGFSGKGCLPRRWATFQGCPTVVKKVKKTPSLFNIQPRELLTKGGVIWQQKSRFV